MQLLKISHLTEYGFPAPVELLPHRLLLRPREGHDVRIVSSRLEIVPAARVQWHRDVLDNSVAVAHFAASSSRLSIASEVVLEHYDEAPLDFIVEEHAVQYPFDYGRGEEAELAPFRRAVYPEDQAVVAAWVQDRGLAAPTETYVVLDRLNRAIGGELEYGVREEPGVQSPAVTLGRGGGSCRDYAALFMEASRHLGLAARFVSGYLHAPATEAGPGATHAWAEVYLPGAGWKGFDPTGGEVAGGRHIPVAVARHPERVPPVAGSFRGAEDSAPRLQVDVRVTPA
jgi:transglutaminase-like putative cysteine protease